MESRTELTDNSITTGNSWSDPKPRKFGGLTETEGDAFPAGVAEKEASRASPSVMQISVWPVITGVFAGTTAIATATPVVRSPTTGHPAVPL